MASEDQLSAEDLNALRETHKHLVDTKDPRAAKVGQFLMSQIGNDPSLLSPIGAGKIPSAPITNEAPSGPGFMDVMGNVATHGPRAFMDWATGHPLTEVSKHGREMGKQSVEAFKKGDPLTGIGTGLASFIPGSGDEALAAGTEFGEGNVGGGAAHSIIALAPFLVGPVREAAPKMMTPIRTTGKATVGGIKGGVEAFKTGKSSIPAMAGSIIGEMVGGHRGAAIGAGLGALPGTLEGIYQGAREALAPPPPIEPIPPVPFKINPVTASRMRYGGPSAPTFNPPGVNIPRRGYTPPEPPALTTPTAPEPFRVNPVTAKKMKYTASPVETGMPTGSAPIPPRPGLEKEGPLVPVSAPPTIPGGPSPYDLSGKLTKFTPSSTKTGMPSGTGGRTIRPISKPVKPELEGAPVVTPIGGTPIEAPIISPVEGKPARYPEMVQTGGTILADYGTNIDAQIAKHLKSRSYKPEDVMGMSEDTLYNLAKSGVPNLRKFGTSGKASRPFAIRQRDIYDALSKEWGR